MQTDLAPLRRLIVETCMNAGEGHIPSALSILEIVHTLYSRVMAPGDRFILSKGHGCLALYAVLADRRVIPAATMAGFCQPGGYLRGHPERDPSIGIEATTGSLGHGMPMAAGLAQGLRMTGSAGRVFCLVGDGECEEGSIWEAAHIAARFKISNLVVIVDANRTSPNNIDGPMFYSDVGSKFAAFGWFVSRVNGHRPGSLETALQVTGGDRPFCLVADTIKGNGIEAMERDPAAWHHRCPKPGELAA